MTCVCRTKSNRAICRSRLHCQLISHDFIHALLSPTLRYTVEWIGREGLDIETHEEYLNHFISHFYKNIVKLVDRAMRKEDSSAQGQIVTEILQHLHACNNSVKVFYGREDNLEHIKRYMLGDSDKPLVLYGEGGCGKTSMLAKSASLVATEWFADKRPINVIRFLGTTPDSSALTPTLISICQQVSMWWVLGDHCHTFSKIEIVQQSGVFFSATRCVRYNQRTWKYNF